MKRKPIKRICTEMDLVLAARLERARGALTMERLQQAAEAACAAVREELTALREEVGLLRQRIEVLEAGFKSSIELTDWCPPRFDPSD